MIGTQCSIPRPERSGEPRTALLKPGNERFIREGHLRLWSPWKPPREAGVTVHTATFELLDEAVKKQVSVLRLDELPMSPPRDAFNHGPAHTVNDL